MGRETRALVGLEHMIAECVLLRHLEVWRDVRRVYVVVNRIGRGARRILAIAGDRILVGAVHLAAVVHRYESLVRVVEIVVRSQRHGSKLNGLPRGIYGGARDISAGFDQDWILKEIIGRAVFLKNHHHMLDLPGSDTSAGT